jgi:5,10-methylene-tetrahydrofolate dehydrogenase/methenyl tetrahydrofolate cyclohydrolase
MSIRAKVAVVGGGSVVGGALVALLDSTGYCAQFIHESPLDKLDELLSEFQLLIIAPALSAEHRQALLDVVRSPAALVQIPVLELLTVNGEQQHFGGHGHEVLWPCSKEELKQAIDAALVARR